MSMSIGLEVQGTEAVRQEIKALGPNAKQAYLRWVNWIGIEAQREMRTREVPTRFKTRGTLEQFQRAVVFQSAKSGNGERARQAILKVGADGAAGTKATATLNMGRILARHENADTRTSSSPVKLSTGNTIDAGFFIPSKAIRTDSKNPPRNLFPSAIGATLRRDGKMQGSYYAKSTRKTSKRKGEVIMGATFIVTDKGIFRWKHDFGGFTNRHGESWYDRAEPLWWFTKRIRTPARLHLWETAQRVFETRAVALGHQAIEETLWRATR